MDLTEDEMYAEIERLRQESKLKELIRLNNEVDRLAKRVRKEPQIPERKKKPFWVWALFLLAFGALTTLYFMFLHH